MKVVLFIPCYNVAHSVVRVLEGIPAATLARFEQVLLIDNASTDATRAILQGYLRTTASSQFRLFLNEENYSLGGSTIIAFREAMARGADFLVCLHSDGQADPADLEKFFPLQPEEDFVCGSRMLAGSEVAAYSRLRYWGNIFFARWQQRLLRQEILDIGAFLAFNLRTVAALPYHRLKADMGYHPALVLYAATQKKLCCREFPISWGKVERSQVNIFVYGARHFFRLACLSAGIAPLQKKEVTDFRSWEWKK